MPSWWSPGCVSTRSNERAPGPAGARRRAAWAASWRATRPGCRHPANAGSHNGGMSSRQEQKAAARAAREDSRQQSVLHGNDTPAAAATLKAGTAAFDANHFEGTPSFLLGKTGGPMTVLNWTELKPAEFTGPIDRLLGS